MLKGIRRIAFGLALVSALVLIAACGGDDDHDGGEAADDHAHPETTVDVTMEDLVLTAIATSAPHGDITFAVQNLGALPHELLVVRTDLAHDALPVAGAEADEAQLEIVLRVEEFDGGLSMSGTVELDPGNYALLCNVAGHYAAGMSAPFTVE